VPPKLLEEWLDLWRKHFDVSQKLTVALRPHTPGSSVLELSIKLLGQDKAQPEKAANVIFEPIQDRYERNILSIRDQNTFAAPLRRKRLMTLAQLFLIHRYKIDSIHYLTPTDDNRRQTEGMKKRGIFKSVNNEVGEIIVCDIHKERVKELVDPDRVALGALLTNG
jgi:isocitrate lyase